MTRVVGGRMRNKERRCARRGCVIYARSLAPGALHSAVRLWRLEVAAQRRREKIGAEIEGGREREKTPAAFSRDRAQIFERESEFTRRGCSAFNSPRNAGSSNYTRPPEIHWY